MKEKRTRKDSGGSKEKYEHRSIEVGRQKRKDYCNDIFGVLTWQFGCHRTRLEQGQLHNRAARNP